MNTYPYVEDYLEVLAGKRDPRLNGLTGSQLTQLVFGVAGMTPIINLARYDVAFVDSVTNHTMQGHALTEKQAELAVKIVKKYTRQLASHDIDTAGVDTPVYRKTLRVIDQARTVGVVDGEIQIKFSYNDSLISQVREMGAGSHGGLKFDRESKVWRAALTEYNVNWVCTFAQSNEFVIDDKLTDFMKRIIECEQTGYKICLVQTSTGYTITNAANNLMEYIENDMGGFHQSNRNRLVDAAAVMGYQVEDSILLEVERDHGSSNVLFMVNREYDLNDVPHQVPRIVEYATLTNRWPIVVFNPTLSDIALGEWQQHVGTDDVLVLRNSKQIAPVLQPHHRVVYTHTPIKFMERVPLLVSHAGMLLGSNKQLLLSRADKVIYSGMKLGS